MVPLLLRSVAAASLLAVPSFGHDGCGRSFSRFAFPPARIRVETERVWVEPVFDSRIVGFDLCGRPIRRQFLLRPGHWATRTVEVRRSGAARRR